MDNDRAARLLPVVVLAVILGLFGMHALVVADTEHQMSPAPQILVSPPTTPAPMNGHTPAAPTLPSTVGVGVPVAGAVDAADLTSPGAPHNGHSSAHQLLHLCLAILAALLVMLAGLLPTLITTVPDDSDTSRRGRGRRAPPRRPPPTSVRLAQLGVMRN